MAIDFWLLLLGTLLAAFAWFGLLAAFAMALALGRGKGIKPAQFLGGVAHASWIGCAVIAGAVVLTWAVRQFEPDFGWYGFAIRPYFRLAQVCAIFGIALVALAAEGGRRLGK